MNNHLITYPLFLSTDMKLNGPSVVPRSGMHNWTCEIGDALYQGATIKWNFGGPENVGNVTITEKVHSSYLGDQKFK